MREVQTVRTTSNLSTRTLTSTSTQALTFMSLVEANRASTEGLGLGMGVCTHEHNVRQEEEDERGGETVIGINTEGTRGGR